MIGEVLLQRAVEVITAMPTKQHVTYSGSGAQGREVRDSAVIAVQLSRRAPLLHLLIVAFLLVLRCGGIRVKP